MGTPVLAMSNFTPFAALVRKKPFPVRSIMMGEHPSFPVPPSTGLKPSPPVLLQPPGSGGGGGGGVGVAWGFAIAAHLCPRPSFAVKNPSLLIDTVAPLLLIET